MPPTDSRRFAQIRPRVPQSSPNASASRRAGLSAQEKHAYWGNDRAVEGGPKGLRQRGRPPHYYFERQWHGQTVKKSLGRSLAQARMWAQQWVNSMERGDFSMASIGEDRIGLGEFLEEALEALRARGDLGTKSMASYRSRIAHFLTYLREDAPTVLRLSQVTQGLCQGYVEWRRRQKVSRSGKALATTPRSHPAAQTVHDDVRRLRGLFKVGVDRQHIRANPWTGVTVALKANKDSLIRRALEPQEVKRLLRAGEKYDRASDGPGAQSTFRGMFRDMIQFYLLTGLRKDELIHLTFAQYEKDWGSYGRITIGPLDIPIVLRVFPTIAQSRRLDERVNELSPRDLLFVNPTQAASLVPANYADQDEDALLKLPCSAWNPAERCLLVPSRVVWRQKATAGRVPLTKEAAAIIARRRKANPLGSPFVFPHPRDGGPLRSDPLPVFKDVLKAAGLPASIRIHDLRHTFGFTLRREGVPIETLMGLMRHANIEETMVYAGYSDEEGDKAIHKLSALWR